jgi:hypothetical protein
VPTIVHLTRTSGGAGAATIEGKAVVLLGEWTVLQEGIRQLAHQFLNQVDGESPGAKLAAIAAKPNFDLDRLHDRTYMKLLRAIADDLDIWWPATEATQLYWDIKATRDDIAHLLEVVGITGELGNRTMTFRRAGGLVIHNGITMQELGTITLDEKTLDEHCESARMLHECVPAIWTIHRQYRTVPDNNLVDSHPSWLPWRRLHWPTTAPFRVPRRELRASWVPDPE